MKLVFYGVLCSSIFSNQTVLILRRRKIFESNNREIVLFIEFMPQIMICKKELLILISILISTGAKNFSPMSYEMDKTAAESVRNVRKVDPLKEGRRLVRNIDFATMFKNLRRNHTPDELRIVGTLGLLSGALRAEEAMRENLYHMTDDLLDRFNKSTPKENMQKLLAIEETINRDKSAISILNGMLRYARNATTLDALEKDMQHILHEVSS